MKFYDDNDEFEGGQHYHDIDMVILVSNYIWILENLSKLPSRTFFCEKLPCWNDLNGLTFAKSTTYRNLVNWPNFPTFYLHLSSTWFLIFPPNLFNFPIFSIYVISSWAIFNFWINWLVNPKISLEINSWGKKIRRLLATWWSTLGNSVKPRDSIEWYLCAPWRFSL